MTTTILSVVELWLSLNGTAELALSIPLAKCQELAVKTLILSGGYDFSVTLSMGEKDISLCQMQVHPSVITLQT